jgi:hypothetical protein
MSLAIAFTEAFQAACEQYQQKIVLSSTLTHREPAVNLQPFMAPIGPMPLAAVVISGVS